MSIPTGTARLAALQIGSRATTAETLDALMARRSELIDARPDVLVLPDTLLGGDLDDDGQRGGSPDQQHLDRDRQQRQLLRHPARQLGQ